MTNYDKIKPDKKPPAKVVTPPKREENRMTIWLLRIDCMGGAPGEYYKGAFVDEEVANMRASEMKEEFMRYLPEEKTGEEVDGGRCIVGSRVFQLDKSNVKDEHCRRGLAKLTDEEKEALGLKESL